MKPLRRLKVYQFASCDQRAWNSNVFKCKVSLLFERDWTRNSWGIPPPSAQGGDTAAESRRFIFVGWGVKQYLSPSFSSFYYFTLTKNILHYILSQSWLTITWVLYCQLNMTFIGSLSRLIVRTWFDPSWTEKLSLY